MTVSAFSDITPSTSSDEIKALAEQVIQEAKADSGAVKSDAQIVSEHASASPPDNKPPETIAENKSGKTTADKGEITGSAEESPEWLTDDVTA